MDLNVLLGLIALPFIVLACRGAYFMAFPKPGSRRWSGAASCVVSLLVAVEVFRIGGGLISADNEAKDAPPAVALCREHFEVTYQCQVADMTEKEPSIGVIYMFGQANKMVNGTCYGTGQNKSLNPPDAGDVLVSGCGYKAYCIIRHGAVAEARITGPSHWPGGVDCRTGDAERGVFPVRRGTSLEKQMRGAP